MTKNVSYPSTYEQVHAAFVLLCRDWALYRATFFEAPDAQAVLNALAPTFFGLAQRAIAERIVLSVARLLDRASNKAQTNTVLESLVPLVNNNAAKEQLLFGLALLRSRAEPFVTHRHKAIAHSDAEVSRGARILDALSVTEVDAVLDDIADWLVFMWHEGISASMPVSRAFFREVPSGSGDLMRRLTAAFEHFGDESGRWPLPPFTSR